MCMEQKSYRNVYVCVLYIHIIMCIYIIIKPNFKILSTTWLKSRYSYLNALKLILVLLWKLLHVFYFPTFSILNSLVGSTVNRWKLYKTQGFFFFFYIKHSLGPCGMYAFKYINKMLSTLSRIIPISKNHHTQPCKQGSRIHLEWNYVEISTVSFLIAFS